jgi:hypothetical protein
MPYVIQASTDLAAWLPVFTNVVGGPVDFIDSAATNYGRRFYRILGSYPDPRPKLSPLAGANGGGFKIHVDSATSMPYALQASTNLAHWAYTATNLLGGPVDFVDDEAANFLSRCYRAILLPEEPPAALTVVNPAGPDGALLRIDGAARPFSIEVSTNSGQWTPLYTNLFPGRLETSVCSSAGSADTLTAFLLAGRSTFLDSSAFGRWPFTLSGAAPLGAWVQVGVTGTNGTSVLVSVTNQSATATPLALALQLSDAINSTPALQGTDGVVLEDLTTNLVGKALFNFRTLSPGWQAAGLRVILASSATLSVSPAAETALTNNLSDLQPRNHLYVAAGATALALSFPLNTTTLADGFHELSAVAYEGSHVRTQGRITLPISIQNSSLTATLTLLDLPDSAPVQGAYHIEVAANSSDVSAIRLFSRGGLLDTSLGQSTTTFTVNGSSLGAGLHPFYALVETVSGLQYRTPWRWARLVNAP